jgi:CubicO group peptidase (beta-lactamase class C family)
MFRLTPMSSRRALLTGGLASLLPFTVRAQSPARARELLGPLLSRHRVPGASVALIRDGEIAELAAIGADPQTLFQAASISKVVTAVTVRRLAE